jgi:hypothetical protein
MIEALWGLCRPTVSFKRPNGTVHLGYWSVMWSHSAVCGSLVQNVGLLAPNVGLRRRVLAANLVPFLPCLWAQALLFVVHYTYRVPSAGQSHLNHKVKFII